MTRDKISKIPDGEYSAFGYIDDDGYHDGHKICVTVKIDDGRLCVYFNGTHDQVKGFVNCSVVTAITASEIAVLWFLGSDIPHNSGAFGCVGVNLPKGSLVNQY